MYELILCHYYIMIYNMKTMLPTRLYLAGGGMCDLVFIRSRKKR